MHPALSVVLGLVAVLILVRFRAPMGPAFLLGSLVMAFSAGMGPGEVSGSLSQVFMAGPTWMFVAQVTLVFVLSVVMQLAGSLDVVVSAAGTLIRNRRLRLASLPALVGLLPMPGGAVVSAPLVERTRCDVDLGQRDKNLVNYWYRHVWEVCWPLYPPLLLAATFLPGEDMTTLCLGQAPLMVMLVAAGWWFILRPIPGGRDTTSVAGPVTGRLSVALAPLVVVIVCMPVLGQVLAVVVGPDVSGPLGLVGALVVGLLVALGFSRPGLIVPALKERKVWSLLLLAVGVKVFGGVVADTGAARATAELVRAQGLPPLVAIAFLPFFIGFVSGATIAVVTVSFPVIVALVGGGVEPEPMLPYLVLGYATGFVGYMLSPVHLCLVLSSRFFGETVGGAYGRLWAPLGVFLVGAAGLFSILNAWLS